MMIDDLVERGRGKRGWTSDAWARGGSGQFDAEWLDPNGVYLPSMIAARVIFFLLMIIGTSGFAQTSVTVRDTGMVRGKNVLPVYVVSGVAKDDTLTVHIAFDPRLIEVGYVVTGNSGCDVRAWKVMNESAQRSVAMVEVVVRDDSAARGEMLRCGIDVLSGPDTVTIVEPVVYRRNGRAEADVTMRSGRISIRNSDPIILQETEYLGPAYPSASRTPVFAFRTSVVADLTFTIFDAGGHARIVEQVPAVPAGRGTYVCASPLFPTLCAGMYVLRMESARGEFWTPFIVLR